MTLSDSTSPQFVNDEGGTDDYQTIHFRVPEGADRLLAAYDWQGDPTGCLAEACEAGAVLSMELIDPQGRLANVIEASGAGNADNGDVLNPVPGEWTAVVLGHTAADSGYNGPVEWQFGTDQRVAFGSVSPSTLTLAPGQSQNVSISATTPSSPGDSSGSIVISSSKGGNTSLPVTLRSLIDVGPGGGSFSGVIRGGNGRPPGEGQEQFYEFDVPSGVHDITADLSLSGDAGDPVGAYLISPDGDTLGYGENVVNGTSGTGLSAYTLNPAPGRWTLMVVFAEPVVGDRIAVPYTGDIRFDAVRVSASGVPNGWGARLTVGTPVTIPVSVTNTGSAPEDYFVDPRLQGLAPLGLTSLSSASVSLPMTGAFPEWLVPTETSRLSIAQSASLPATFDFGDTIGDPDLSGASFGAGSLCRDNEATSYRPTGGKVTAGVWYAGPTECGPYTPAATAGTPSAPAGTATDAVTAWAAPFDPNVTSTTGDLWQGSVNPATLSSFAPVTVDPGHTGVIDVTITPSGTWGTHVTGDLYVDTADSGTPTAIFAQLAGNELAAIPYSYTIR